MQGRLYTSDLGTAAGSRNSQVRRLRSPFSTARTGSRCLASRGGQKDSSEASADAARGREGGWLAGLSKVGSAIRTFLAPQEAKPEEVSVTNFLSLRVVDSPPELVVIRKRHAEKLLRSSETSPVFLSPLLCFLPGGKSEYCAEWFQAKFGIPLPILSDQEEHLLVVLLWIAATANTKMLLIAYTLDPRNYYEAFLAWELARHHKAFKPDVLSFPEGPRRAQPSSRKKGRQSKRVQVVALPEKGFGSSGGGFSRKKKRKGSKYLSELGLDHSDSDDEAPDKVEDPEQQAKAEEERFKARLQQVFDQIPRDEDESWWYLQIPRNDDGSSMSPENTQLVNNACIIKRILDNGHLRLYLGEHFPRLLAALRGTFQAPQGAWEPELAEKGLFPHYADVLVELERQESKLLTERYAALRGLDEDFVATVDLDIVTHRYADDVITYLRMCELKHKDEPGVRVEREMRRAEGEQVAEEEEEEEVESDSHITPQPNDRLPKHRELLESKSSDAGAGSNGQPAVAILQDVTAPTEDQSTQSSSTEGAEQSLIDVAAAPVLDLEHKAGREGQAAARPDNSTDSLEAEALVVEASTNVPEANPVILEASEQEVSSDGAVAETPAPEAPEHKAEATPANKAADISLPKIAAPLAVPATPLVPKPSRQGETLEAEASTSGRTPRPVNGSGESKGTWSVATSSRQSTEPQEWTVYEADVQESLPVIWEPGYVAPSLRLKERYVWKAAGIVPYTFREDNNELMVLLAYSRNQLAGTRNGFNVLGGKRKLSDASAEATAIREMTEETGGLLSGYDLNEDRLQTVLWYPDGGYAAFMQKLSPSFLTLPQRYEDQRSKFGPRTSKSEPLKLVWLPLRSLEDYQRGRGVFSFLQRLCKTTELVSWLKRQQWESDRRCGTKAALRMRHVQSADRMQRENNIRRRRGPQGSLHKHAPVTRLSQFKQKTSSSVIGPIGKPDGIIPGQQSFKRPLWPPSIQDHASSDGLSIGDGPGISDGLGLSLERGAGEPRLGRFEEQWNNGIIWSCTPPASEGVPDSTVADPAPGSAQSFEIEPYPKTSKGSLRVFHVQPNEQLRETIEDNRPLPADLAQRRTDVEQQASSMLASSLFTASAAFLPAIQQQPKLFSAAEESCAFSSTLFPACVPFTLPEVHQEVKPSARQAQEEEVIWRLNENQSRQMDRKSRYRNWAAQKQRRPSGDSQTAEEAPTAGRNGAGRRHKPEARPSPPK